MAYIIHSINVSIGWCCDHRQVIADEEHHAYAANLLSSAEALLFGRNTFDLFEQYWPVAAKRNDLPDHLVQFGRELANKKKYVMSSRALNTDWEQSFLISGDLDSHIAALRAQTSGNVVIFGSPSLACSLAEMGQIDEFHFLIQPFANSSEPRIFAALPSRLPLRLRDVTQFASGVVLLRYVHEA